MAPYVSHSLQLLLLGNLFRLLLFLLQLEALRGSLELLLVHYEEVTWTSLGEVGLREDVLHASDRTHVPLVVDVLQLVRLVWLIDYSVALLKVDELAGLLPVAVVIEEAVQGTPSIVRWLTSCRRRLLLR